MKDSNDIWADVDGGGGFCILITELYFEWAEHRVNASSSAGIETCFPWVKLHIGDGVQGVWVQGVKQ